VIAVGDGVWPVSEPSLAAEFVKVLTEFRRES